MYCIKSGVLWALVCDDVAQFQGTVKLRFSQGYILEYLQVVKIKGEYWMRSKNSKKALDSTRLFFNVQCSPYFQFIWISRDYLTLLVIRSMKKYVKGWVYKQWNVILCGASLYTIILSSHSDKTFTFFHHTFTTVSMSLTRRHCRFYFFVLFCF